LITINPGAIVKIEPEAGGVEEWAKLITERQISAKTQRG